MSTQHQARVPDGVPTGGQYAATEKPEPELQLVTADHADAAAAAAETLVECPHCHTAGCRFCGGDGYVTRAEADDYFAPRRDDEEDYDGDENVFEGRMEAEEADFDERAFGGVDF